MSDKAFVIRPRLTPFQGTASDGRGELPAVAWPLATIVVLALVLGGGTQQGLWSDAVVQLAAVGLLAVLAVRAIETGRLPTALWPGIIALAIVLLPLVQLIPLPPSLWTLLPGRAPFAATFHTAAIPLPWLPISLDPAATWRTTVSLLPPLAVFLATVNVGFAARRSMSLVLIGFGVASVLLGLAQLAQGPSSPLRFFPITNVEASVGFFANRNHYAALLYSLVPMSAAWLVGFYETGRRQRVFGSIVGALVYVTLILGIGMSLSRAGVALAALATFGGLLIASVRSRHHRLARGALALVLGASFLGVLLVVQFASFDLFDRLDQGVLSDLRFPIAEITIAAARPFQPFGSGLGTFEAVYRMAEVPDALLASYINHAHSDWLELWLEGGWAVIAMLFAFLVWALTAGVRVWMADVSHGTLVDRALAWAATVTITLLALHSAIDYPLRTTAIMVVFAYCCALLVPPPSIARAQRHGHDRTPATRAGDRQPTPERSGAYRSSGPRRPPVARAGYRAR